MTRLFMSMISTCFVLFVNGQDLDLNMIRKDFNKGVKDEDLCKKHYEALNNNAKTDLERGYKAAFQMFMAKHTGNPIKKMSYFKGGKSLLDTQIKSSPANVELRFIRLCIQFYTPGYLGYRSNINEDKEFLLYNLYKLPDEETKVLLFKYLKGANIYTDQELAMLVR